MDSLVNAGLTFACMQGNHLTPLYAYVGQPISSEGAEAVPQAEELHVSCLADPSPCTDFESFVTDPASVAHLDLSRCMELTRAGKLEVGICNFAFPVEGLLIERNTLHAQQPTQELVDALQKCKDLLALDLSMNNFGAAGRVLEPALRSVGS